MEDNSVPAANTNEGSHECASDEQASQKGGEQSNEKLSSNNGDSGEKTKALLINGFIFAIIESGAWVVGQFADGAHGSSVFVLHWISICGLLLGPFPFAWDWFGKNGRRWLCLTYFVLFLAVSVPVYIVWKPIPEQPPAARPHFLISLQIGDSTNEKILLTNNFLFRSDFLRTGALPGGRFTFKGYSEACLLIPTEYEEKYKVFTFSLENDSPVTVDGSQVMIGIPESWEFETEAGDRWEKLNGFGFWTAKSSLSITNMQFWFKQAAWSFHPLDEGLFPAIRFKPTIVSSSVNSTGEMFMVAMRATGLVEVICANVVCVPADWGLTKPVLIPANFDSHGDLHITGLDLPRSLQDWVNTQIQLP